MPNAIQVLDNGTRSKLRSTQIITSLPQIVSEMIQNSLDAGAKHVDIAIDHEEWGCFVRDDGKGITKGGLEVLSKGVEGGRYVSSKAYDSTSLDHVETFGFRGEALASISDLSSVEISSKARWGRETWTAILKDGKRLYFGLATTNRRQYSGTMVIVRDAFFNVPVRRNSHPSPSRTLELVKRDLESFALMFPEVTFSLVDSVKERRSGVGKGRVVQIPKSGSSLDSFRSLFGKAIVEHFEVINEEMSNMKISGFVSLVGVHTKAYQFLYINRHILDPCDLHRVVDQKFSGSSFGKHAFDETGETKTPRPATRRSPRKSERKPAYVLNIHVPPCEVDNCIEPSKSSVHLQKRDTVASFLADVVNKFLTRHGFLDEPTIRPKKRPRTVSPTKGQRSDLARESSKESVVSVPLSRTSTEIDIVIDEGTESGVDIVWTDPVSHRTYLIDPRTGNSYSRSSDGKRPVESDIGTSEGTRRLVVKRDAVCLKENGEEMPEWIREALEANNTFSVTERPIPTLPYNPSSSDARPWANRGQIHGLGQREVRSQRHSCREDHEAIHPATGLELSCELLLDARVVNQVDRKFIACLVDVPSRGLAMAPSTSKDPDQSQNRTTLYLIDQHAADERIRVERFLRELCIGYLDFIRGGTGVETRDLEPTVPVLVRKAEAEMISENGTEGRNEVIDGLRRWGFGVCEGDGGEEGEYVQVWFKCLPEVVADKLLSNSALDLTELVRAYLERRRLGESKDYPDPGLFGEPGDPELGWLKALRYCPRELVDLVNSKACRGAVMFNDELTMSQCRRLVRKLADCAFPFICAHGRPSIVPLVRLGESDQENHHPLLKSKSPGGKAINWDRLNAEDA